MQPINGLPEGSQTFISTNDDRHAGSIDEFIQAALVGLQAMISRKMIRVDLDLSRGDWDGQCAGELSDVIFELIRLGVESTPVGGELSITLVASPYQWELEVADSAPFPSMVWYHDSGRPRGTSLVRAIPMLQGKLETIIRGAQALGGTVQSWGCPQGGTANVLTMPRRQQQRAA